MNFIPSLLLLEREEPEPFSKLLDRHAGLTAWGLKGAGHAQLRVTSERYSRTYYSPVQ
jgi:hypothetical protein